MADTRRERSRAACDALGIEQLRSAQQRGVDALVSGRDCVAVMPTGAGKTAVYLVAGAALGGLTVVVSPLRALQRDQLPRAAAVGPAAVVNSDQSPRRRGAAMAAVAAGELSYLYLGPEQLQRPDVVAALAASPPTLFAVDEAHCLSSWGPDFRPDYLRVGAAVGLLDHPPVVAVTATAAPPVRQDIATRLGLVDPLEIVDGFDRPEIHLAVEHHHDPSRRDRALVERAAATGGSGLVYTATRRRTVELSEGLRAEGVAAAGYHGTMKAAERRRIEAGWADGTIRVVVATSAFGMGIDKADVRFVLHAEMAESLDAYAQETGRAGRDGEPAVAVLYHRSEDMGLRKFFASRRAVPLAEVEGLFARLRQAGGPLDVSELATPGHSRRLARVLTAAESAGAVEVLPGGAVLLLPDAPAPADIAAAGRHDAGVAQRLERSRVDMLERYAATGSCRRRVLLSYFGQEAPERCGNCDQCDSTASAHPGAQASTAGDGLVAGARVVHGEFGAGEILTNEGGEIVVVFDEAGYRTLAVDLVEEGRLLRAEGT